MAEPTLEERVALLEQELTQVKGQLAAPQQKDWLSTFGAFADDPLFDEVVEAGREYRQALQGRGGPMMILDTDHFSEFLKGRSSAAGVLRSRLVAALEPVAVTIVTAEELMRGWLSLIHRQRTVRSQIPGYAELGKLINMLGRWEVLPWDDAAATSFENLRASKLRIGTMDLKIASIALSRNATVLTRNRVDFDQVLNLQVQDWLSSAP